MRLRCPIAPFQTCTPLRVSETVQVQTDRNATSDSYISDMRGGLRGVVVTKRCMSSYHLREALSVQKTWYVGRHLQMKQSTTERWNEVEAN